MENEEAKEILSGLWESLTDEQKEKAKACKTKEELIALAADEGIELSDEMLEAVAGGYTGYKDGSYHVLSDTDWSSIEGGFATLEAAQARAEELGVKTDRVILVEPLELEPEETTAPENTKTKKGRCGH